MTRLEREQVALSFQAQARNPTVEAKITHLTQCDPLSCGRSLTSVRDDKSKNDDRVTDADEVFDTNGVPIGQANAAVTGRAPDRLRVVRSVNSNSRSVQPHPKHADQVVWAGRQIVIFLASHAVVQHR